MIKIRTRIYEIIQSALYFTSSPQYYNPIFLIPSPFYLYKFLSLNIKIMTQTYSSESLPKSSYYSVANLSFTTVTTAS